MAQPTHDDVTADRVELSTVADAYLLHGPRECVGLSGRPVG
jgi:hypothetical protein